jgi:phosphoenolpyruvate synthase/pyruvate phosphate dikinase
VTQGGAKAVEKKLITPLLEKVKKGRLTPEEINEQLFEIQAAIKKTKLPDETVRSLYELANGEDYQEFKKIRFRSSTNCEDLPRFNGAGLYLSEGIQTKHLKEVYTSTKSMNKLHEDLLLVLSSLWLPRAFWEREYFSIDHSKAAIAVQINPSFTDEAANGVIIASKKEEVVEYWVNSQFGEASVTNPVRGEVPESIKYSSKSDAESDFNADIQRQRPTLQNASSIGNVFIKNTFGELDEQKIDLFIELLRNTKVLLDNLVEDPRKYGIDIEFKLVNEDQKLKLYLKQARPINLSHTY